MKVEALMLMWEGSVEDDLSIVAVDALLLHLQSPMAGLKRGEVGSSLSKQRQRVAELWTMGTETATRAKKKMTERQKEKSTANSGRQKRGKLERQWWRR